MVNFNQVLSFVRAKKLKRKQLLLAFKLGWLFHFYKYQFLVEYSPFWPRMFCRVIGSFSLSSATEYIHLSKRPYILSS